MDEFDIKEFIRFSVEHDAVRVEDLAERCGCSLHDVRDYVNGVSEMPLSFAVCALRMIGYHLELREII